MAINWNGVDLEERFNLFLSGIIEDIGIDVPEEASTDLALEQDYADILNRISNHLDMAMNFKN